MLDYVPLWAFCLVALAVMLLAGEGGYQLGRRRMNAERESTVGAIVGAILGLLAFMLAFTFGLAASRFDTRRELLQQEVNAIGTTYLRADLLPGQRGPKVRRLLRQYVDAQLGALDDHGRLPDVIRQSEIVHGELWELAMEASRDSERDSELVALFVVSLNEMIDLHTSRLTAGLRARIPGTIWGALLLVSFVSMASVGYFAGLTSATRSIAGPAMIVCFVIILLLIADLDRPLEGLLRVNQQGMIELRQSMGE